MQISIQKEEKFKFRFENNIFARRYCFLQKIKHIKQISKDQKCKIIGGGCKSSKFQIQNPQQISLIQKVYNEQIDYTFKQKFEYFTNKENIAENLKNERQGGMQLEIIEQLKSSKIHIRNNIIFYKPMLVQVIDVYLIYILAGSSQSEDLNQNEIEDLGYLIKDIKESLERESQDQPCCDLIFYFDLLHRFNSYRIRKDEQNKNLLIKATEFITKIVEFGAGVLNTENFKEGIKLSLQGSQLLLKSYDTQKTKKLQCYLLDIWVRKYLQFETKIWNLNTLEQLEFYITIFIELCNKQYYENDLILLTLIKIDHYFSLTLEEDVDKQKVLSKQLSFDNELIKIFIPQLIQKSNSQSMFEQTKSFLEFVINNNTYRFLTTSILLKYNQIVKDTNDFSNFKENIMTFLGYQYLKEKNKQVKLAFETNTQFVENFNTAVNQEEFQNKIIKFSQERIKNLNYFFDLKAYDEKFDNLQDKEIMISKILIDKWEMDIKKRQKENIAQKDDLLLEVQNFYIQQQITYLEGNKIIQERRFEKIFLIGENQSNQKQNAMQQILDNFLQVNNFQTQENQNINISSTEEQIKCKILGILAEGGTGKSMLIKKIETYLIQSANSNSEKENYIPLLIKCNSLDPISPSIENYLLAQGVSQKQITIIKNSDRNKVILLDGYEEYSGEYFRVYEKLELNQWKKTKVIITSRNEKLELNDACAQFSLDGDNGLRDETSFCIVKLEEFTKDEIQEYCERYFTQFRTNENQFDEFKYLNDMQVILDCMNNLSIESLLYLPINLYLFTRMVVQINDKSEIQKMKEKISDQIGIQEIFFNEQFKRESQDFLQTQINQSNRRNNELSQLIMNSYFEYFQSISMKMFLNKGKSEITNFLQIRNDKIEFKLSKLIENKLSEKEKQSLHDKIIHYVNSKIITRSKEEKDIKLTITLQNNSYLIEFSDKSLFEYFVARAMKYDFDVNGDNIHKLTIEDLKEFNINKKIIMNAGKNQSEQQILIKVYKMIQDEIEQNKFYQTYYLQEIEKNSKYIQYVKKSTIKKITEISQIDIGASNMLSILFFSKFNYPKLDLNYCSFSYLFVSSQKSNLLNFNTCNLQNSYLKNLRINYDSCNTQFAIFDTYQKIFDTLNIFSFNYVIWDQRNMLYTITQSGFINAFKVENQNILLQKSKQLSQTPLSQVLVFNSVSLLVSSKYSLLLINSSSFDLLESYKFQNDIRGISLSKENIIVTLNNGTVFYGSFKNGFRKISIIGYSVVFSVNGKYLVTGQEDNTFKIWNSEKGFELINTIQGHADEIFSVAFSADGKYLATGSRDETCKIWNVEKGFELINTIQGHRSYINSVAFSADGKYLATGSYDNTCKIWNAEKGFELINTIQGHIDELFSVAFSGDGKYLATGSADKTCKIWNGEKGFELINKIQGHTNKIFSIAFSANGKYLATGSQDQTCKIWNVEKGFELFNTIQGHTESINSYLATGSSDNTCKLWNVLKGFELFNTIQGHTESINSVDFSADGKYLATGSSDNSCKIWNAEKNFELFNTIQGHTESVNSVDFSADGKYLATGSSDNTCKIWNAEKNFELINTFQDHSSRIYSIAFSPDGKYLSSSYQDQTYKIWNTTEKNFELINTVQGHSDAINSVTFSADGNYLATGSSDQTCKIWNAKKGFELINTIQGHTEIIFSVAFSADGKYLATGSADNTCKIWNAEKGFELIKTIKDHIDKILSVAFSRDGKYLATSSADRTCKIWNAEKKFEFFNKIQGLNSKIYSIAFSANGKYLATGLADNTCKIWNPEKDFELINIIQGHTNTIFSVAFSVDGKHLATGSSDKTCKIWNAERGFQLINTIQGHTGDILSIDFSADGKYLATGSQDKTCKLWDIEIGFKLISTIYDHVGVISSVAFSSDGKYFSTGSFNQTCKIHEALVDFQQIKRIKSHAELISSIRLSSDGKYIASSQDNTCKIYHIDQGIELIHTFQNHTELITSIAISIDGKYLAVSFDKTCNIWNTKEGFKPIAKLENHSQQISSIAFSSDGRYLATGSYDKTCNIWQWNEKKSFFELFKKIMDHTHYVSYVTFSTDGKYLATGSSDKTCKIWNEQNNFELINEAKIDHDHYISSIAFSVDGKYLATGSWDKTCKIWDVENNFKQIKTIQNGNSEIFSVFFSQDSQYLSICSMNGICTILPFNATKNEPILSLNQVSIFQFSIENEFIYVEQSEDFYKVYVIKDFYPLNKMDISLLEEKTKSFQQEKQNEMIYLQYRLLFKYMLEL